MRKPEEGAPPAEPSRRAADSQALAAIPKWFPLWASRVSELYYSRTTSMFVLHGNVHDLVRMREEDSYGTLSDFLAEQLFGRWGLVLYYDLARGLRALAGRDAERLKKMVPLANSRVGDLAALKRDPASVLAQLDRFVQGNIMAPEEERLSVGVVINHASSIVPSGEPGQMSLAAATNLVTLLNWAASPHVKHLNMAFVLVDEKLSAVNERLTGNPHVASVEVPLPEQKERDGFIRFVVGGEDLKAFSDFDAGELAKLTAGITLTDVSTFLQSSREGGPRLDAGVFRGLKKRLIERQAQGLLEFIEPKWTLDMVIGHEAAKRRLKEDAALIKRGALDSLPMGYLLCGPVGTGKTFMAQCATGEIGIPCVMLKNFRSKYVGETEGNLERVLSVLRAMGPVVVVVDEADAALGNRDQEGDSGTSSRVFGMIASQMGDSRYRGRILWMLLTCRPDLLPIDIKRQGRAEVHIPLFYPVDEKEVRDMFVAMARKMDANLSLEDVPPIPQRGKLSGADIEGMVGRALRRALLAGHDRITRETLGEVVSQFMPSTEGLEKELQETAAILECTDREFLTPEMQARVHTAGGRGKLQERLTELKRWVENL